MSDKLLKIVFQLNNFIMKKVYLVVFLFFGMLSFAHAQCNFFSPIITYPSVDNDFQGEINILPNFGQGPFDITFDGILYENVFSQTISGVAIGSYEVTMVDGTGCTDTRIVEMIEAPFTISEDFRGFIDCNETEYCLDILLEGGTLPYTITGLQGIPVLYENTGRICDFALFLPGWPGPQNMIIEDATGLKMDLMVEVDEFNLEVEVMEEFIDCNLSILTAVPDVSISEGPYEYLWSTGETTQSIEVTSEGVYRVDVTTPGNSCHEFVRYIRGVTVGGNVFESSCASQNDGMILLLVNSQGNIPGGAPGFYNYSWSGPDGYTAQTGNITGLAPGMYGLTVTSGDGCVREFGPWEMTSIEEMSTAHSVTNPSCFDGSDASILFNITGGSAPYTITVDGIPISGMTIENLAVGDYATLITDAEGCTLAENIQISGPPVLMANMTATNEACGGKGSASVIASGGTPPYAFTWSNGANTPELTNLIAGIYTVTVTDGVGCMVTTEQEIQSPIDLSVSTTETSCNTNDGTATAIVSGGATAPSYAWNIGNTTASVSGLAPDWYSVTVTDEDTGCQVHRNIEVVEDPSCYVTISGVVYLDAVMPDCAFDTDVTGVANARVALSDGQVVYTNALGEYIFTADAGTYTVTVTVDEGNYEELCVEPITVNAETWGAQYVDHNFYVKYGSNFDIRITVDKPTARPGFFHTVHIHLTNDGAIPATGTVTFIHPVEQTINTTTPEFTNYDFDNRTLTWTYNDLLPGEQRTYKIFVRTPIGTPLGTELEHRFSVTPILGDLTPENNEIVCTEIVTGSYDPNDKAVIPAGIGERGIISMADSVLNYRIRFQNTGTDTAFTVLIRDTLDADLDLASLKPGPSSHPYTAKITNGNVLELLFENILLPDSFVNEPASNGHVFFTINIKRGSPYGTIINNRAAIFFDYNEPIITNTVVNTIEMITATSTIADNTIQMKLSPNPMSTRATLRYTLESPENITIHLYDLLGNQIRVLQPRIRQTAGTHDLEISDLNIAAGIYYVSLKTESGNFSVRKMMYSN